MALVGDAAHPTFPFFAQGAAMAIEDAEALAAALADPSRPVAESLRLYDKERRPYTQRLVDAASENGRIYHLDGPMRVARNATLAVIPGSILMARYDWIYRDKRPVQQLSSARALRSLQETAVNKGFLRTNVRFAQSLNREPAMQIVAEKSGFPACERG